METRTISLSPSDLTKPILFELTNGNIKVAISDNDLSVDMEYVSMGSIVPEVTMEEEDAKNIITIKNSEVVETNLLLTVPRNVHELEINMENGDIFAQSYKGDLNLQVTTGGIKLRNISGKIKAVTFNGEINIDSIKGELNAQLTNGPLKVLGWQCSGGSIEAKNSKVIVGLDKLDQSISIKVKNGSITLGIPRLLPCTIIAHGSDVVNYLETIDGKSLGSPAKIVNKEGTNTITLVSSSGKVKVANIEQLDKVVPDFEKWFEELEKEINDNLNFDELASSMKSFGKNLQKWGLNFAKMFSKSLKTSDEEEKTVKRNGEQRPTTSSEKMEILNLLKAGKISADEAEKLLKALK